MVKIVGLIAESLSFIAIRDCKIFLSSSLKDPRRKLFKIVTNFLLDWRNISFRSKLLNQAHATALIENKNLPSENYY